MHLRSLTLFRSDIYLGVHLFWDGSSLTCIDDEYTHIYLQTDTHFAPDKVK